MHFFFFWSSLNLLECCCVSENPLNLMWLLTESHLKARVISGGSQRGCIPRASNSSTGCTLVSFEAANARTVQQSNPSVCMQIMDKRDDGGVSQSMLHCWMHHSRDQAVTAHRTGTSISDHTDVGKHSTAP